MTERPNLLAGEDLPAEPRQKRSLDKRARLKRAALELFGERGYERTSIEDIAGRAKLAIGGFYLHYRSKRQLLLALMDELPEGLSRLKLEPAQGSNVRSGLRALLSAAFRQDLRFLGAHRAWQEAVLSDADLARLDDEIHAWTTARVAALFGALQRAPGAREQVDIDGLARAMDLFFWSLLGRAMRMRKVELDSWINSASHLIYHGLFQDDPAELR